MPEQRKKTFETTKKSKKNFRNVCVSYPTHHSQKFMLIFILFLLDATSRHENNRVSVNLYHYFTHLTTLNHPTLPDNNRSYGLKHTKLVKAIKYLFQQFQSLSIRMSGDVEPNPGPFCNFKKTVELFTRGSKSLKFFHINCQSIAQKKRQVEMLLQDLGNNAIFGFSETWLKEDDSGELWQLSKDFFKTFRSDRKTSLKD